MARGLAAQAGQLSFAPGMAGGSSIAIISLDTTWSFGDVTIKAGAGGNGGNGGFWWHRRSRWCRGAVTAVSMTTTHSAGGGNSASDGVAGLMPEFP